MLRQPQIPGPYVGSLISQEYSFATPGATTVNIDVPIPEGQIVQIFARIVGNDPSAANRERGAAYVASYNRPTGGAVSLVGGAADTMQFRGAGGAINWTISGTNARLQVTGQAGQNFTWRVLLSQLWRG